MGRASVRPGDAGNGDRPLRRGAANGTLRHRLGGLFADGAKALDRRRGHAKLLLLGQIGVGDKSPLEPARTAGNRSNSTRYQTSGAGLRRRDHRAARERCRAQPRCQRQQWVLDFFAHYRSKARPRYQ